MSKLEKLYELSTKITRSEDELFYFAYHHIEPDSTDYKETINKIKEQVLEENTFTNSMTIEEVDACIEELIKIIKENFEVTEDDDLDSFEGLDVYLKQLIDKCDEEEEFEPDILLRVFDRLKNQTYILCGESVSLKLKTNNVPIASYEISVYDALVSSLNTEVIKRMKMKIFNLVPRSEAEHKFAKDLRYNLKTLEMTSMLGNFASEILYLYGDTKLDDIIQPNVDKLKLLGVIDEKTFYSIIDGETENIIEDLAQMTDLSYKVDVVFELLKLITSFEVYTSHLDLYTLTLINDCCKKFTNDKNYPSLSGITNLVKAKIRKLTPPKQ